MSRIPPIRQNVPIVDDRGRPSPDFMLILNELLSGSIAGTAASVEALRDTEVNGGFGLSGGGALGAGNVTLNLDASLDDLNDVDFSTPPTNGQIMIYDAASETWLPGNQSGGGGGGAWTLVDQLGAPITSGATWTHSTNVANVDIINLGSYTDLMVVARNVTSSASGNRNVVVSVNNGASFYTTSGDYVSVSSSGAEANAAALLIHDTATTLARSLLGTIPGSGAQGGPKWGAANGTGANGNRLFVASPNPINALRFLPGGGNLTGGVLYVYAR